MDEEGIKAAVLGAIAASLDARALAAALGEAATPTATTAERLEPGGGQPVGSADKLLTKIVLGDILDDSILSARPTDRTFPLRSLFAELGGAVTRGGDEADVAFSFAAGLNFFFRSPMDAEGKLRVGLEVSRALYAFTNAARLDSDLVARAAPLLAALMTSELGRAKFESVDHMKVFDSQVHERTPGSDPSGSHIVRPASFLCRVAANNAVKAKAQVLT